MSAPATPTEMRGLAHRAVTEGVDLKYLERMRQALYAAADALEQAEKERDQAVKARDAMLAAMEAVPPSPQIVDEITKQTIGNLAADRDRLTADRDRFAAALERWANDVEEPPDYVLEILR